MWGLVADGRDGRRAPSASLECWSRHWRPALRFVVRWWWWQSAASFLPELKHSVVCEPAHVGGGFWFEGGRCMASDEMVNTVVISRPGGTGDAGLHAWAARLRVRVLATDRPQCVSELLCADVVKTQHRLSVPASCLARQMPIG